MPINTKHKSDFHHAYVATTNTMQNVIRLLFLYKNSTIQKSNAGLTGFNC